MREPEVSEKVKGKVTMGLARTVSDPAALRDVPVRSRWEGERKSTYYIVAASHAASDPLNLYRSLSLIKVPAKLGRSSPSFC